MALRTFKGPRGTRDVYPEDMLRRRYIVQSWRDTSIRHGFEEIEGPAFEQSDLYAVKSGEGILGELFQAFSGKSPEEVEQVKQSGRAPFALRPEFTPTLARMYAARARQLPKPTRWFMVGPFFRAERPQRGRLREFLQWNCDVIGSVDDDQTYANLDLDCTSCCVAGLVSLGLSQKDIRVSINHRLATELTLRLYSVPEQYHHDWFQLLDRVGKINYEKFIESAEQIGSNKPTAKLIRRAIIRSSFLTGKNAGDSGKQVIERAFDSFKRRQDGYEKKFELYTKKLQSTISEGEKHDEIKAILDKLEKKCVRDLYELDRIDQVYSVLSRYLSSFCDNLDSCVHGDDSYYLLDQSIVRGLAYYTGFVFEVVAEGERAIAGGGRYDNLIELLGGPPTPAVGFAMGDVVLSLLLEEKGLMPEGVELMEVVSRPGASLRPEAFVIGADDEGTDPLVRRLVADLRRGVESGAYLDRGGDAKPWQADRYDPSSGGVRPLHARSSDKSTRNLKKLLADAERQASRFAVIIHGADRVQIKDMDTRRDLTPADVPGMSGGAAEFSVDPGGAVYAGRAIDALTRAR